MTFMQGNREGSLNYKVVVTNISYSHALFTRKNLSSPNSLYRISDLNVSLPFRIRTLAITNIVHPNLMIISFALALSSFTIINTMGGIKVWVASGVGVGVWCRYPGWSWCTVVKTPNPIQTRISNQHLV